MMEGGPMVCYWTGAINSLVHKLTLLREKHPPVEGLLQDLESLRDDIVSRFGGGRATDEQVKVWMKQVRELVYDIEDWLDPMLERGGEEGDCSDLELQSEVEEDAISDVEQASGVHEDFNPIFKGEGSRDLKQTRNLGKSAIGPMLEAGGSKGLKLPSKFRESKADSNQLEEFKAQILEARDRCTRYNLLNKAPTSDDPNLVDAGSSEVAAGCGSLLEETTVLVGLDGPKRELEEHLEDYEQRKLKVVSVLGVEGLGKTTLAKEIYDNLKQQFECQAVVSGGHNTSTETIIRDIHRQVNCKMHFGYKSSWDERQLIPDLWMFLSVRRYFIFIDDIRSTWTWSIVRAALPDNGHGSRILTTTCIKDVAASCSRRPIDVVYQMKALGHDDSRSLLLHKISIPKEERPVDFEEVSNTMLNMCGSMPLAIIVTAGLLTRKSAEVGPSKVLQKSMLPLLEKYNPMTEGMRKILDISFSDLSLPVKSCFLYLSAFPGNYTIRKDSLIRRWAAEGLLPKRDGKDFWETGQCYFNDLVTRGLIQPVFDDKDDKAVGCTVHCVVHEFITSLSSRENFVTTGAELYSRPFPCDTIRRFSVDSSKLDEFDTLTSCNQQLRRVRSLTISGGTQMMHDLGAFEHIRVLDIENPKGCPYGQLESIGKLSLLKYLGIRVSRDILLHKEIEQLEHLTTLDVRGNETVFIPALTTAKLVSLLADNLALPKGMKWVQELEELSTIVLDSLDSLESMAELVNKSKKLRMLGVTFSHAVKRETHRKGILRFLNAVGESSIRSLSFRSYPCHSVDLLLDRWAHERLDHNLQEFMLGISDEYLRIPQGMASLVKLTHLDITVYRVEAEGVHTIGKLPNLAVLSITYFCTTKGCIISKECFQCLKILSLESSAMGDILLQVEAGAMPQLRRLHLGFDLRGADSWYPDFNFGIQHLSCLVQVSATIYCKGAKTSDVEALEAMIVHQVSGNPNNPSLKLSKNLQIGEYFSYDHPKVEQRLRYRN
ncbi:hypothetical protein ACP4OV_002218 [Aristida adscensionis]